MEFVASVYNVFLRRAQVRAVELCVARNPLTEEEAAAVTQVSAADLVACAMASGDINEVREIFRKKNLEAHVRKTFERMQMIQRRVRGSETQRDVLIHRFTAMRLWNGCSSLFFTLNPHDIRSPISMLLVINGESFSKEFSLDWSDEQTDSFISEFLCDHPRRLHELVGKNPLAATQCFHWTVKLVIQTLFNCAPPGRCHADAVPANEAPGKNHN